MTKRLGWAGLALGIVAGTACSGDEPAGASATEPQNDASTPTTDGGGVEVPHPALDVRVVPIAVVRGSTARVPVTVFRTDTSAAVTLELQNAPVGVTPGGVVTLAQGASAVELSLATSEATAYGDFTVQLAVTSPDLPAPVNVPIALQVRGVPGSLDTSFGEGGHAAVVPNGSIGDMFRDSQGRFVISAGGNLQTGNMVMARLTPTGTLDPAFGTAGVQRWTTPTGYYSHPEIAPGYYRGSAAETSTGYSLVAYLEHDQVELTDVVLRSDLSPQGMSPTFVPAAPPHTDLGSVNAGSLVLRDGEGFFLFRRGCRVERRAVNNALDLSFGTLGSVDLTASGCFVREAVETKTHLFVLLTTAGAGATRRLVVIAKAGGAVLNADAAAEPLTSAHLSRSSAEGHVLATYGTAVTDVSVASPATVVATVLKGSRFDAPLGPTTAKGSLGFFFADGTLGALVFDAKPIFHRLSATGENLEAAAGVPLEEPDFARYNSIVEAYPDDRGGLVLLYPSGTADPLFEHWTIKRFWL